MVSLCNYRFVSFCIQTLSQTFHKLNIHRGAPYDPHAYAMGWVGGDEGHQQALTNLEAPDTRASLFNQIEEVMREESKVGLEAKWEEIFRVVHDNAVMLPLWGKRIPTVSMCPSDAVLELEPFHFLLSNQSVCLSCRLSTMTGYE